MAENHLICHMFKRLDELLRMHRIRAIHAAFSEDCRQERVYQRFLIQISFFCDFFNFSVWVMHV